VSAKDKKKKREGKNVPGAEFKDLEVLWAVEPGSDCPDGFIVLVKRTNTKFIIVVGCPAFRHAVVTNEGTLCHVERRS
jgi:hypothetical protein